MKNISVWDIVNDIRIGWNLGNTLDAVTQRLAPDASATQWETCWGNPVTTEKMIEDILAAGFNLIRVPVSWGCHTDSNLVIAKSWIERVKEVVDYAYSRGAYVILNVHHEGWNFPFYDNRDKAMATAEKIWLQIAEYFKDYDEHLIFETQNEPRKIKTPLEWTGGDQEGWDVVNDVNEVCIRTIRSTGGNNLYRAVMLPSYAASMDGKAIRAWKNLSGDDRVIASIHAYVPFRFALTTGDDGEVEWDKTDDVIDRMTDDMKVNFIDKGIPVILGEMGALVRVTDRETRLEWAEYFFGKANEIGVPCCWWDNNSFVPGHGETFGLYDRRECKFRFNELLDVMMKATEGRRG